jgi:hypothetical protein
VPFHPSAGLYYFSILGGTIFYDAPEIVDIYVISGIGKYDNCWDSVSAAIKPLDVCVHPINASCPAVTEILFVKVCACWFHAASISSGTTCPLPLEADCASGAA